MKKGRGVVLGGKKGKRENEVRDYKEGEWEEGKVYRGEREEGRERKTEYGFTYRNKEWSWRKKESIGDVTGKTEAETGRAAGVACELLWWRVITGSLHSCCGGTTLGLSLARLAGSGGRRTIDKAKVVRGGVEEDEKEESEGKTERET